ncbi:ABC transporter permease [Thermomonas flagellata]|uniref:ABC transporter permease n=1 Tax=Thermomonas flagellata TaxID=2888524 RepID=UPI001F047392|nr:ABC transporter permease [Thermomonas flagellata]
MQAGPIPFRRQHVWLAWELTKREWLARYRHALLGRLWALAIPVLMLGVYLLAFGPLVRGHWPGAYGWGDFALAVFIGLAVHGLFSECLMRAPTLVTTNPSYVTRIVFPLDLLPWPILVSASVQFALQMLVLLVVVAATRGLGWSILTVPLLPLPLLPFLLGLLWMLGALGVYVRDLRQLVAPASSVMLFLSSALVPLTAVPERWRWVFEINPLTPIIEQLRRVLLWGLWPQWWGLFTYLLLVSAFALAAHALFMRLRPGFADVL